MSTMLVVGLQWGDEGKGKIVDAIADSADVVMRYQGGANSGHTIYYQDQKVVLHHMPSGIFQENTACLLGWGMVISPDVLLKEIEDVERLTKVAVTPEHMLISGHTTMLLPLHKRIEIEREKFNPVGTTKRGIGPAYEDRIGRRAIRVVDVVSDTPSVLKAKIEKLYLFNFSEIAPYAGEISQTIEICTVFRDRVKDHVRPLTPVIKAAHQKNKRILFEGAQGVMLDIGQGTYPYVTSSMTGLAGAYASLGTYVPIQRGVGIAKAYCTRVGHGPFPSELFGDTGSQLQEAGHEFGATTGRRRRVGWLDLVQLRYAIEANGIQDILLTKLDVLSVFSKIGLVVGYKKDGKIIDSIDGGFDITDGIEPVIEYMPSWSAVLQSDDQLVPEVKAYCERIEAFTGARISGVSYGQHRDQTVCLHHDSIGQLFEA